MKVYLSVDKTNLSSNELQEVASLCQQLHRHLQKCIKEVHQSLIPCAREPIGYLECPINHEGCKAPHLRLSEIGNQKELICPKSSEVVSLEKYNLLLASLNYRKFYAYTHTYLTIYGLKCGCVCIQKCTEMLVKIVLRGFLTFQ